MAFSFNLPVPLGKSVTSADAIIMLMIDGLIPAPILLQGFSPDDVIDIDSKPLVETHMGIDGHLSQGVVLHPRKVTIHLSADSPSQQVFDIWALAMSSTLEAFAATMIVTFPSNHTEYTCINGALTGYHDMPNAKKTLQPQTYEITFESVFKASL